MVETAEEHNNNNNTQVIKMSTMSTSQNILIRLSIVLGMAAAVWTVIYLTPIPGKFFKTSFFNILALFINIRLKNYKTIILRLY